MRGRCIVWGANNNRRHKNKMDIIYLNDLRIDTIIGIYDWERRVKQTISLDLEMASDIRKAAGSDDIEDTLRVVDDVFGIMDAEGV